MSVEVTPGMFSSRKTVTSVTYRPTVVMFVVALFITVVFGFAGPTTPVSFRLTPADAALAIPDIVATSSSIGILMGITGLGLAALSLLRARRGLRSGMWLNLTFGFLAVTALLSFVGTGNTVPVTFLLTGTLALSAPLILGAMSGVLSERVGVVNIAIEAQLLSGAFVAAVVGTITENLLLGVLAAMVAGALVGVILAWFSIRYFVDQIIVGVVLNVLVIGITDFLHAQWLSEDELGTNFPGTLSFISVPFVSEIPVLGPLIFSNRLTVYLVFLIVPLLWFILFRTKYGLRLRSVGEYPLAADTMGINVALNRFVWVTVGGMIAGIGGAALSIGNVGGFVREMSSGQGFIALAAVILGRWHPLTVSAAALLFGFASIFRIWAGQVNAAIPSDFIQMIPYLVTLIAVAGFVGRVRPPAAAGKAYTKE